MQQMTDYSKMNIEKVYEELKQRLSPDKFKHCCKTAEIAVRFAQKLNYDVNKAEIAALLHDVASELTQEQLDEVIKRNQGMHGSIDMKFELSFRACIGSFIARDEFGILDEEILHAIKNHVTGRPCMKTLEQIVFLADYISKDSFLEVDISEILAKSFDEATYQILGYVIEYDAKHKRPIDERTMQTFDWLIERIHNESQKGQFDVSDEELQAFYDKMDNLMELYSEHVIKDFSSENIRDLGGYINNDGRVIRKGKIIRSGNLDNFKTADYERLAELGINYVIDLRLDSEKTNSSKSCIGNLGINYIEIPFASTGDAKSYIDMLLEWVARSDDAEEFSWLCAKYFDAFDMDDMYMHLLLDTNMMGNYKKIFEIMISDDCTGVLYFCQSGKDRTGIVSSLILQALGVDSSVILDDYMISQVPYYGITLRYLNQIRKPHYNLVLQKQVFAVLGVNSERPKRLNKLILSKYKDYKNYFDFEQMFDKNTAELFRKKFLDVT